MENLAEMGGRRPAASRFSATCRRLSQYLKEKGSFGELGLSMVAAAPFRVEGKPETLRTLNLLPGVATSPGGGDDGPAAGKEGVSDHPVEIFPGRPVVPDLNREQKAAPMTIFFGGKVVVFNNFPADKAKELMDMAGRACPPPVQKPPVEQPAPVPGAPPQHHPSPAAAVVAPASETQPAASAAAAAAVDAVATPTVAKEEEAPRKAIAPASSDLPIARRVSLHRFLEKRKDRITAKAPYQVHASPGAPGSSASAPAKGEDNGREWLGLTPQGASKPGEDPAGGWRRPAKSPAKPDSDCS